MYKTVRIKRKEAGNINRKKSVIISHFQEGM